MINAPDEKYMRAALAQARKAARLGEVPIGALVVKDGVILARACNLREKQKDPCAHAEILALRKAAKVLGGWRLEGCSLYVTLEPCPMCAGAAINARIDRIIYGATDEKAGCCGTLYDLPQDARFNHRAEVTKGILAAESAKLLKCFFAELRKRAKTDDL